MSTYRDKLMQRKAQERLQQLQATVEIDIVALATQRNPWQADFIHDTRRHKALFGERRSGKTTLMGIAAIDHGLTHPYSKLLYVGLTSESCQRVMYDEVLSLLVRKYNLPAKLVGGDELRFDNGSILYLIGLDANKKQKEKVRGTKASLILIDEMQSYTQDTSVIINDVLGPAAADTKAAMIIGGTAGNINKKSYWYQITKDNTKVTPINQSILHPEWQVYRCEWEKNNAIDEQTNSPVCDNVREYLTKLQTDHPGIQLTDSYRQEWNAEWITITSALIYRYTEANLLNHPTCTDLSTAARIIMPTAHFLSTATYVLGLDLGYNDPTAMTVCCYNLKYSNKLYVIETFNQSSMLVPEIADKIKSLDKLYHFTYMVGDSSSLQVFETLKQTYSLPIEKANRAGKLSHQLVLNSDLQCRSVVIFPGNDILIDQLASVQWQRQALEEGRYVEDPSFKNDQSDSFLYAHHFSRHLWYEAPNPKPVITTQQEALTLLTKELLTRNRSANGGSIFNQDFSQAGASARRFHGR